MAGVLNNTKKKTREICTKDTAIITLSVKGCYCSFRGAFSSSFFLFFFVVKDYSVFLDLCFSSFLCAWRATGTCEIRRIFL